MLQSGEKRQVTWFFAFKKLLGGIGSKGILGLKAAVLVGALCTPFIFSFQYFQHAESISGAIPPSSSMIKATGIFVRKVKKQGIREVSYIDFITNDGKNYPADGEAWFDGEESLARSNPPIEVYVEGFVLKNGTGSFFATLVKLEDGHLLLSPENAMNALEKKRDYKNYLGFICMVIFLWIVSLFNIYKLQKKLSMEV